MASGHCYVVNSGLPAQPVEEVVTSLAGESLDYEFTDYDHLTEELFVLDMSLKQFAEEVGCSASTVYSWKRWHVPPIVLAYMRMKLKYEDKVNPEQAVRLS